MAPRSQIASHAVRCLWTKQFRSPRRLPMLSKRRTNAAVHRDLKPANIKITSDSRVKVLDFGLAKALEVTAPLSERSGLANSPTLTSPARLTGVGEIVGTAAYMSPEQAKGQGTGRAADLWAFGCVLYEMLTGTQAFQGGSVSEILSDVLKSEPDWTRLPVRTPESVRRVLRRCLVKDPRLRLQHAADARLELQDAHLETAAPAAGTHPRQHRITGALPWLVAGTSLLALTYLVARMPGRDVAAPAPIMRFDLNYPPHVEVGTISAPNASISPDGSKIAFTGQESGLRRLFVRRFDEDHATVLMGTDLSSQCYFSADGSAVLVESSDRTLKRVSLADGLATVLARGVDRNFGAGWGSDDRIAYVTQNSVWQIDGAGGSPTQLTTLDEKRGERFHAWPAPLPGGKVVLFTSVTGGTRDAARIEAVDVATRARHVVVDPGAYPIISSGGHLIFLRDSVLVAAPFDLERQVLTGPVVRVSEDVAIDQLGAPLASLSPSGAFVYLSNDAAASRVVWVTRQGLTTPVSEERRVFDYPRMAPDGRRLSASVSGDVWQLDTDRSTLTRVTAEASVGNSYATWHPDGERVIYRTAMGLRIGRADGGGSPQPIPGTTVADFPHSVSRDGKTLVFTRQTPDAAGDVYALSLVGEPNPHPVFSTPAYEGGGQLSPDGRWLAYASNESGRYEVYVRQFADPSRKYPVSVNGGTQPMWNRDATELFYRNGSQMLAVRMTVRSDAAFSRPEVLFDQPFSYGSGLTFADYDVAPDGRFVMVKRDTDTGRLNIVLNWSAELKRLTARQ